MLMVKWRNGLHINWERFRYWRSEIGFQRAYYKLKAEAPSLTKHRGSHYCVG